MKKFFEEFKAFISKGNVVDMAIAVIVGGAFGKIVTALVNDIIMPLVSLLVGGISVTDWKWVIRPATDTEAETALSYGDFIQSVLDFLIVSFCIFLALKAILALQARAKVLLEHNKKPEEPEAPAQPVETQEDILRDIRDLLRENNKK